MVLRSLVASLFMMSASAFAASGNGSPSLSSVSLDDLKAQCANILANPQMVKPKVKVTCNELSYYWAPAAAKNAQLPNQRTVGSTVQMKGFVVDHLYFPQQVANTAIQCQSFQKIERQVHNVATELTCEQLADIKDLGAFCAPILDQRASADPTLVEEHPTNEVISLCPAQ